jgi:G3E family GTPase
MSPTDDPLAPIPLVILTGFLGAGKTTRLNAWLADPAVPDTLVIINEFGEIGLDHLFVEEAPGDMVLMAAGCLCCTIRGDLVATLEDLLRRRDNKRIRFFRRVIIETTGIANPLPILQSVLQHPYLSKRFRITGTITLVDAVTGRQTLQSHAEAYRQVALADAILLTKTDLAEANEIDALVAEIASCNPTVTPIREAQELPASSLFDPRFEPRAGDDAGGWLAFRGAPGASGGPAANEAGPHGGIESMTLFSEKPVAEGQLAVFREAMRVMHGPKILRMKGLVATAEDPERPLAIHQVQSTLHPPVRLSRWPSRDRRTRIVCITQGIPGGTIESFWNAIVAGGGNQAG